MNGIKYDEYWGHQLVIYIYYGMLWLSKVLILSAQVSMDLPVMSIM